MTLLKKPKREDFRYPASYPREHYGDCDERGYDRAMIHYYKQLAEYAVSALERLASIEAFDMSRHTTKEERMRMEFAEKALAAIRQTEEPT